MLSSGLLFENGIDIDCYSSFVEAVYLAANLTDKDVRRSYKLPIVSIVPIISTYLFLDSYHIPTPWIQMISVPWAYRKS